ncbi:hypothetical protein DRO54_03925 [Candidatus Bathyarchaeota archaeon]|nr:MAG: hypothetical protein DRO54_03925 [Candidatus Bathyarchaeota archaeon]
MSINILKGKNEVEAEKLRKYVFSKRALWYWVTLFLLLAGLIAYLTIPRTCFPLAYIRNFFGLIFVLWLPGYTLFRVFFYKNKESLVETITMSIGLSIAITYIIGLALNYSPWQLQSIPIALSLFAFSLFSSTAALILEFRFQKRKIGNISRV